MPVSHYNPATLYPPLHSYSHATEVWGDSRMLFISGLTPYLQDGDTVPDGFDEQADLVWRYLIEALQTAGMGMKHLVSLRTYLADPSFAKAAALKRVEHLSGFTPAGTTICCQLLDPRWKIEIEAVAAT